MRHTVPHPAPSRHQTSRHTTTFRSQHRPASTLPKPAAMHNGHVCSRTKARPARCDIPAGLSPRAGRVRGRRPTTRHGPRPRLSDAALAALDPVRGRSGYWNQMRGCINIRPDRLRSGCHRNVVCASSRRRVHGPRRSRSPGNCLVRESRRAIFRCHDDSCGPCQYMASRLPQRSDVAVFLGLCAGAIRSGRSSTCG